MKLTELVRYGNKDEVLAYIEKNKSSCMINFRDHVGSTALIHATDGKIEIVKALLKNPYIDVNIKNINESTALIEASRDGHTEIVRELLSHPNIKINIKDQHGDTALMKACIFGHVEIFKLLLSYPFIELKRAFHLSIVYNRTDIISLFDLNIECFKLKKLNFDKRAIFNRSLYSLYSLKSNRWLNMF